MFKIMKFRVWCFSWAPGNLYSLEFTIWDTTGCPHMISWWSQSRVIFVKLNQCDKKSHFVNICHRLPPTRNGLSCLFTIIFVWVICLIHKMRWVLVSKDFIHCCHAHLKCQNAYTRVSIWIWSFHAAGSGSGSDLHEWSWFSCCWFSYDPRSFRGQMSLGHKKWWTLWLSQYVT